MDIWQALRTHTQKHTHTCTCTGTHTHTGRQKVQPSFDPGGLLCCTSSSSTLLTLIPALWTEHGSLGELLPPYRDSEKPRKSPQNSVVKLYGALKGVSNRCFLSPPSFFSRLVHHCPDRILHFSGLHYLKSCLVVVWDLSSFGHIFNIVNWWVSVYIYVTAHPKIHHAGDGGVFLELSSRGKQNCS